MATYLETTRGAIIARLNDVLSADADVFLDVNGWGADVSRRLVSYMRPGKMIRGALTVLSTQMYSGDYAPALDAAVSMELIQAFLLIHDDIMDRDTVRRGNPSVHRQYELYSDKQDIPDRAHFGVSMAICAGDVAVLRAFDLVSRLAIPDGIVRTVIGTIAREIATVGLAQMGDVYFGASGYEPSEAEILDVYRYKTARYTFSLPLMTGATIAGCDTGTVESLGTLGEHVGIAFQIRDDELGMMGTADEIGKPVGTDIVENKKTLLRSCLFSALDNTPQHDTIRAVFGGARVSHDQIELVRDAVRSTGALDRAARKANEHVAAAEALVRDLVVPNPELRETLNDVIRYAVTRRV